MMIQEAKIAVPPTNGAKLNTAGTVAPAVIDDPATTLAENKLTLGNGDHGPVQSTTTTINTKNGIHARRMSRVVSPCAFSSPCTASAATGTPP
jgi:hypothetical protein